jgi:hypothetical protein
MGIGGVAGAVGTGLVAGGIGFGVAYGANKLDPDGGANKVNTILPAVAAGGLAIGGAAAFVAAARAQSMGGLGLAAVLGVFALGAAGVAGAYAGGSLLTDVLDLGQK